MRRRKKIEEERENHDRWLVSYADFITLLFAFFVVMYAISSVNQSKYRVLTDALGSAFKTSESGGSKRNKAKDSVQFGSIDRNFLQQGTSFIQPFPALKRQREKLKQEKEKMTAKSSDLSKVLAPLVNEGKVHILQDSRGIRIDIESSIIFMPGSAEIGSSSVALLENIAQTLVDSPYAIQIEGHTDNLPIHNSVFFSNWELSAVRASSVVRLFSQTGISEHRLSAIGYGSAQPLAANDQEEGRAKNRRVSIMILHSAPGSGEAAQR
jgi:chemotaxis protein MotB